ncbi:hypothetical protein BO78DRAFT_399139 [Aspergillus sclerotiicarbonarius CBS 121057]|uniref:Uncharacterized protein n=1 Tax=Aspergillus sclerotiicarbonarius (strain CBS 121057 / IBT 28362) TaxID=1448318 RepID=A0A319ECT9_ASPSB|nr:hypothetical protein BO78DRAFT_399139 [Aspergillus sclerotiicarbonarius CBS 121057]
MSFQAGGRGCFNCGDASHQVNYALSPPPICFLMLPHIMVWQHSNFCRPVIVPRRALLPGMLNLHCLLPSNVNFID